MDITDDKRLMEKRGKYIVPSDWAEQYIKEEYHEPNTITLGAVPNNIMKYYPVTIPQKALLHNIGIFGNDKTGKRAMIENVIHQLSFDNTPFILFDTGQKLKDSIICNATDNLLENTVIVEPAHINSINLLNAPKQDAENVANNEYISSIIQFLSDSEWDTQTSIMVSKVLRQFISSSTLTFEHVAKFFSDKEYRNNISDETDNSINADGSLDPIITQLNNNPSICSTIETRFTILSNNDMLWNSLTQNTSNIDIKKAINNNYNIIVSLPHFETQQAKATYANASLHYIWSLLQCRGSTQRYIIAFHNANVFVSTNTETVLTDILDKGEEYYTGTMVSLTGRDNQTVKSIESSLLQSGTIVAFRPDYNTATNLAGIFTKYNRKQLMSQKHFDAYGRIQGKFGTEEVKIKTLPFRRTRRNLPEASSNFNLYSNDIAE